MANNDVVVRIDGDAKGLEAATAAAGRTLGKFGTDTRKAFSGLGGQIFSLRGALAGIVSGFSLKEVIDSSIEAERTAALLETKLRSTGRASEFTTEQLLDMAGALQKVSTFGDEAIAQAQTTLLGFGRVTGKIFEDATKAALDYAAATGTDLAAAAELVGRALQQPDKAAKQLRSANILLTKSQTEVIEKLVEGGKSAEAQQLILGKLERAYGGAAASARNTFGGALTGLKEAAGDLLEGDGGNLNDAKTAVEELTKTLQSPEVKQGFSTFTAGVITAVEWLAKLAGGAATAAKAVGEFFGELAVGSTVPFQNEIDELTAKIKNTESQLSGAKFLRFPTEQYEKDLQRYRGELAKAQAAQADFLRMGSGGAPAPAAPGTPPPAGGTGAPVEEDEDAPSSGVDKALQLARQRAQAVASAEAAIFKAQQDRQRATLEGLNAQNLISLQDYHAQKLALELAAIDQEIAARQAAMKTADEAERIRNQGEIEALSEQRTAAIEANTREQAEAEKKLGEERLALEQRLLEATGRGAEARAQAIEQEFAELIAKLQLQGDTAGVGTAVQLKGVELARAEFDALEEELSQAQASYQRRLQEIDTAVATGASTRSRARRDQVAAAAALVQEETRIADALHAQADIVGDPALLGRVRDLRQEIVITGQVTDDMVNQIRGLTEDALGGFFNEILDDPKDFADAVDNALLSVERSINRLISQRLSEGLVDSLFGSLTGGGGGGSSGGSFLDSLGDLFKGFTGGMSSSGTVTRSGHSGALIGTSGAPRRVPVLTFADAPRFHSGGMLGADEVPFIGLKGERVLNREETRNYNDRTAPVMVNVNISTPDAASFRRNETEIRARLGDAVRAGQRNR